MSKTFKDAGHRLGSSLPERRDRSEDENNLITTTRFNELCQMINSNKLSFSSLKWESLQHLRKSLQGKKDYFICPDKIPKELSRNFSDLTLNDEGVITIQSIMQSRNRRFLKTEKVTTFTELDFQNMISKHCIPDGWSITNVSQDFRSLTFKYSSESSINFNGTPGDLILKRDALKKHNHPNFEGNDELMKCYEALKKQFSDMLAGCDNEYVLLELKISSLCSDHFAQLVLEARSFLEKTRCNLLCCLIHPNKMYKTIATWTDMFRVGKWSDEISIVNVGTKKRFHSGHGAR